MKQLNGIKELGMESDGKVKLIEKGLETPEGVRTAMSWSSYQGLESAGGERVEKGGPRTRGGAEKRAA